MPRSYSVDLSASPLVFEEEFAVADLSNLTTIELLQLLVDPIRRSLLRGQASRVGIELTDGRVVADVIATIAARIDR